MQNIFMGTTHADALAAFETFLTTYKAKYPKASEKLTQDRDSLLAFYDFPTGHWQHIRTTIPIESTFATVRHRTIRSRNCLSRSTFLGLAFKLMKEGKKSWRKIRGADRIKSLLNGVPFKDGMKQHSILTVFLTVLFWNNWRECSIRKGFSLIFDSGLGTSFE